MDTHLRSDKCRDVVSTFYGGACNSTRSVWAYCVRAVRLVAPWTHLLPQQPTRAASTIVWPILQSPVVIHCRHFSPLCYTRYNTNHMLPAYTTRRRGHLRVANSTVSDPSGSGRVDMLTGPVAAARAVATGAWVKSNTCI